MLQYFIFSESSWTFQRFQIGLPSKNIPFSTNYVCYKCKRNGFGRLFRIDPEKAHNDFKLPYFCSPLLRRPLCDFPSSVNWVILRNGQQHSTGALRSFILDQLALRVDFPFNSGFVQIHGLQTI